MSAGKSNIKTEKNKLSNSSVSAGEKVHIGDIYHINNQGNGNEKEAKGAGFLKYLGITLLSVTLVSVTVKECVLVKFEKGGNAVEKKEEIATEEKPKDEKPWNDIVQPIAPKQLVKSEPKPTIKYTNALEMAASPKGYDGYFNSKMGELLRSANIQYQQTSSGNIANHIKCSFDLQKKTTESGGREALNYSLTLQVDVIGNSGQSCFSGFYASTKPRIGYQEDSEGVLRSKVIEPLFTEVKAAFQGNMPTVCEAK